jgi:hypothetical protein
MITDDHGYDVKRNLQRARYKFAMSRTLARDALSEAKALRSIAERNAWLEIARNSRRDAKYWVRKLREASEMLACGA